MLLRIVSRPWLWSVIVLTGLFTVPAAAQPPSPLELVRGLREHGHLDLAMEYLKELEGKPLSADDKGALLLERAKCLLEASEDEPDEATRVGMVSEAKEGLDAFLTKFPNHPRAVEARLTNAKLTAIDAREQLNRARRMDIPPPSEKPDEMAEREAAMQKQKDEAKKARPMFLLASKRFAEASDQLRTKLDDKTLDPITRRALEREAFEAKLASGVNQFNTAETYMPASLITGAEKAERNKLLEASKELFNELAKGPTNNRTVWVARAWAAEVTYEQDDFNTAAAEVLSILQARVLEAEDGKRLARFFQLRRNFLAALGEGNLQKVLASENEIRTWLRVYGNPRKPSAEVFAVRYYHARVLQALARNAIGKIDPKKPSPIPASARTRLEEAEKLYRALAQTDHDYTARATRQRMEVVRLLLGDADEPVSSYDSFEKAQMASLIQLSKLARAEAMPEKTDEEKKKKEAEIKNRQMKTIALLERSRALATPQDNPADVNDVLLRLIYFYRISGQPYQAAVLGEYVAHTIKATGGKAALAGLFSMSSYLDASRQAKGENAAAARRADRGRAMEIARFLDEKYPNDNPTDAARHLLAQLLIEDKEHLAAFEVLLRVRPAYSQINHVRLLEGYLVQQLIIAKPEPGKELTDEKKAEIFKRAVSDIAKISKPAPIAVEDDVRNYLSARCRLASLLFLQGRADPAGEKANPGYNQSLAVAEDVMRLVPTFNSMMKDEGGMKKLNLDGMEMMLLAQDARTRAIYLRARAMIDDEKLDEAAAAVQPTLDAVEKDGRLFNAEMEKWAQGDGSEDSVQKARVALLAGTVDKTRVDVILAAFRIKVKQAKAAEADALLNLMVKSGGSIENSLPLLEPVGRELAVRMVALRKEGKKEEADALGAGLAVLLKKITTVEKLPQQTILFVGQMLIEVKEYDKATEMLKRISPPDFVGWETKKPEEIPQELRGRVQTQIRDYSVAQLGLARVLRESKKFAEAEKMLQEIIGTNDKPGWGSGRLYFRRELAAMYEDRGAATADPRAATTEWGKALREWSVLYAIQRNRLAKMPKETPKTLEIEWRNAFADAYFDYQRCVVKANQQILAGPQNAAKLQKTFDDIGKKFVDMEKQIPANEWEPEVQFRYADFLKEVPQLIAPYKANGGKLFLERIPLKQ